MLSWCQTKPCRQIAAFGEGAAVTDCGKQRSRVDDADARDGCQPPRLLILSCQRR
jgi:hypothetical protein